MTDSETSADQGTPHIRVITPDGDLTWLNPRELWRYRAFLHILVWRDLKVRYKQTVVGLAWALFEPLAMRVIFGYHRTQFEASSEECRFTATGGDITE